MPPVPIRYDSQGLDLTKRFQVTTAVVASPALAAETVIATLNLGGFADTSVIQGVLLTGWAAYTVGTSGTAVTLRIRQTNVSGTVVATTGALTKTAASLYADDVNGLDAGAGVAAYALTMQVTAGAAASTVSALVLQAVII
jgi:hypothetical protein